MSVLWEYVAREWPTQSLDFWNKNLLFFLLLCRVSPAQIFHLVCFDLSLGAGSKLI